MRGKKHLFLALEPQISTFSCPPVPAGDLTETINTGAVLGWLALPPFPNLPFRFFKGTVVEGFVAFTKGSTLIANVSKQRASNIGRFSRRSGVCLWNGWLL